MSRLALAALMLGALHSHAGELPAQTPRALSESAETPPELPWTLTVVPYVHHWHHNPEHRQVFIASLEKQQDPRQLLGLALFSNSFGQPSAYAYAGYEQQDFLDMPGLSAKVTAGIIYGYTGRYADKVPLNHNGYSPGIVPSLGYQVSARDSVQLMVLGTAGFALGFDRSF
ncbi:ABC transporter ATP-binding protein [Hylemonella sp. W303a]|uniref:ABC transporter ATP-binding protein n=1 Tax=Hylemonella sp. W303a TaxID=3389873 RepID=UPI00396AF135